MIKKSRCILLTLSFLPVTLASCQKKTAEERRPEAAKASYRYRLVFPLGLSAESAVIPKDHPLTHEKLKLGKRLYFEKRLSLDNSISCASCHVPEKGFADPNQFSTGVGGNKGGRQAPAILNRVFSAAQFWDGRAASLEEQALGPILNPVEMAMPSIHEVVERLRTDPSYVADFKASYPPDGAITGENIAKAIASFERTILTGSSPFDHFLAGDKTAMSESAQRGYAIFKDQKKGNCETCHVSFNFTDENYNNIGVGIAAKKRDPGRYMVTNLEGHQGAFKTPTLREVARTGPYMHDGSLKTLEDVVALYVQGGGKNRWLSPKIKPLKLSKQEQADLVEFLKALSGEVIWFGK